MSNIFLGGIEVTGCKAKDLKQVTDAGRKENIEPMADQVIC